MSWKASSIAKELTTGTRGEKLNTADKLVLMILSENYIEKQGYVWCSQKELADQCLCTDRGLRGILERLSIFGLVGIVHRGRKGNYYSLLFIGNVVPQSLEIIEERNVNLEERIEERGSTIEERKRDLEEPAGSSRTIDGSNGIDGDGALPLAQVFGTAQPKPQKRQSRNKTWPSRERYPKERPYVQEIPKRSAGEERAARTARALEVLDHPERLPEHLRPPVSARGRG